METKNRKAVGRQFLYFAAHGLAGVSGVFAVVLATLVLATLAQLRRTDPLDSPVLVQLRERFAHDASDEELGRQIRALDLLARKAYFTAQWQIRTGSLMLLASVVVFLASIGTVRGLRKTAPHPAASPGADAVWRDKGQGRQYVAWGGAAVLAAAVVLGWLGRANMPSPPPAAAGEGEPGAGPAVPSGRGPGVERLGGRLRQAASSSQVSRALPGGEARPGATPPGGGPSREEFEKNWPGFRGPYGHAVAAGRTPPAKWDGATGEGVLWKTQVPKPGYSSPVVWGKRVFCTGGDEAARELYGFDADSGALLWTAVEGNVAGAPPTLPEVNENTGWAAPTPATDGQRVFAMFSTGNILCADFEGKRLWARHIAVPENHYAHSSSPILCDGLLIVQFDDNANPRLFALDPATGATVWQTKRETISWSSPICARTAAGAQLVLTDGAAVAGYEPATGRELWRQACMGGEMGPSAAFAADRVFACNDTATAAGIRLRREAGGQTASEVVWQWNDALPDTASPVATEKLVWFATSGGTVSCVDAASGQTLWEHDFTEGFYASPVLVGDRVYALDLAGVMHVFAASGKFEPLGDFALGEPVSTTPAFVADRIYLRGETHLWCVGETANQRISESANP